jgi:hypothetical protein
VLAELQVALARRGAGRVELLGRALTASTDWPKPSPGLLAEPTYFMPISAAS